MTEHFHLDGSLARKVQRDNRAFLYGDGFFTTIRVLHGQPQLLQYHLARLLKSSDALSLSLDSHAVQSSVLTQAAALEYGVIKVHVSRRSVGKRGYAPQTVESDIVLSVSQLPLSESTKALSLQSHVTAAVLPQRISLQPTNLVGLKTLNRLENILAAQSLSELQRSRSDVSVGLVCAVNECVVEAVSSNVFFLYDGQWMTPSLQHAGVSGTLRQAILDVTDVAVLDVPLAKLHEVDAAFLCNAVRGIQPVSAIYDAQHKTYISPKLHTQAVTHFYEGLCDNASFMAQL